VEDLYQVAALQRPALAVAEQERFTGRLRVSGQPRLEGPRRRRPDEGHPILLALAGAHEQASVARPPVLNQQVEHFAGSQARIGEDEHQRAVPRALQRVWAGCEHGTQFLLGGHVRQGLRRAHRESAQRVLMQYPGLDAPPEERLERAVRLVLKTDTVRLGARQERAHHQSTHLGRSSEQSAQPPRVNVQRGLGAACNTLGQKERLNGLREGVSLCFFGGFWRG
jgi:hypothetical protein